MLQMLYGATEERKGWVGNVGAQTVGVPRLDNAPRARSAIALNCGSVSFAYHYYYCNTPPRLRTIEALFNTFSTVSGWISNNNADFDDVKEGRGGW